MWGKLKKETEKGIQYRLILGGGKKINITRPAYDVRVFRSHNTDPFLRGATFYNRAWRQVITCFWCLARSFALRPPTPSHARDRARSP